MVSGITLVRVLHSFRAVLLNAYFNSYNVCNSNVSFHPKYSIHALMLFPVFCYPVAYGKMAEN